MEQQYEAGELRIDAALFEAQTQGRAGSPGVGECISAFGRALETAQLDAGRGEALGGVAARPAATGDRPGQTRRL